MKADGFQKTKIYVFQEKRQCKVSFISVPPRFLPIHASRASSITKDFSPSALGIAIAIKALERTIVLELSRLVPFLIPEHGKVKNERSGEMEDMI
jgi:hypothetical protein